MRMGRWTLWPALLLLNFGALCSAHAASYYVSANGDDAHAGMSPGQAWQSLARVSRQPFLPGDRILLRGGDMFAGSLTLSSFGSEEKPITLGAYGRGRAIVQAGSGTGVLIQNAGGWLVKDLRLAGAGREVNGGSGLVFRNTRPGNARIGYVRIENVDASGFGRHGILVEGAASDHSQSGYQDVRITRCQSHDNAYTGIYVTGVYDTKTTRYANADVYVGHCAAYDNPGDPKYLENHSGSGIFLEDVDGGVVERCVARNNGALCECRAGGPIGIWAASANNVVIQFCESHHNHTGAQSLDGGGFDLDGGVTNSLLQYNYSHDNDGAGYLLYCYPNAPHTFRGSLVRYNISQNDGRKHHYGGIYVGGEVSECSVFNNTVFLGPANNASPCALIVGGKNTRFCNNILVATGGVPLVEYAGSASPLLRGNCYWSGGDKFQIAWNNKFYGSLNAFQVASGQERQAPNGSKAVGLETDPLLARPGGGGTLDSADKLNGLDAYRLRPNSPLVNAGVNMPVYLGVRPGLRDFYGTSIPQGHDYDIGACERRQ